MVAKLRELTMEICPECMRERMPATCFDNSGSQFAAEKERDVLLRRIITLLGIGDRLSRAF
jgi:hypothetical protein